MAAERSFVRTCPNARQADSFGGSAHQQMRIEALLSLYSFDFVCKLP